MTPGFASAASRKLSIWGGGGWLARKGKGTGRPKVRKYAVSGHSWVGRGEGKGRRLEGRADPGAKVSEGGQRAVQGKPGLKLPTACCPGEMRPAGQQSGLQPAFLPTATLVRIPSAQGPGWAPGPRATAQCLGPLDSWTYLPVNELLPRLGPSTPDCTGLTPDGGDWLALPSLYLNFYLLPSPTSPTP